ncbi:hypothetical protein KIW84_044982 [Lathyrus oleraceus]|uniref:Mitochondrial protein n=1 Tax=Pisum sativum TaxID=3888 RepID=A0A9D4XJX7_PEA|nr:hypothetical protein KIW84_044982 [Pisum sativum]
MEELTYVLGLQIKLVKDGTFISQTEYCLELLKKFNMQNSKSISIPTTSNVMIDNDKNKVEVDITKYRVQYFRGSTCKWRRSLIIFCFCLKSTQSNCKLAKHKK